MDRPTTRTTPRPRWASIGLALTAAGLLYLLVALVVAIVNVHV